MSQHSILGNYKINVSLLMYSLVGLLCMRKPGVCIPEWLGGFSKPRSWTGERVLSDYNCDSNLDTNSCFLNSYIIYMFDLRNV